MSFKLFTLQLLGKIKPVEKVEAQRNSLWKDYNEFIKVENSEELKHLLELEKRVHSEDFKGRKAEIQALQFRNSKEYNLLNEFEKLKAKKSIRKYFSAAGSAELKRFESLKNSEKLKEYNSLLEYVKEGQFDKDKKEVENQTYKGSPEEKHYLDYIRLKKSPGIKAYLKLQGSQQLVRHEFLGKSEKIKKFLDLKLTPEKDKQKKKEYKSLKNDSEIKSYFKFEHSKELRLYRETAGSYDLTRYEELTAYVDNPGFRERVAYLKDKKKFEKTDAYKKYIRFRELEKSDDIRFFLKYEKSPVYKNYLDVKDSFDLKRYEELHEVTSSKEFQDRKQYLEDKKKWEKSEEYALEQKYLELKNRPHIVKYFKYQGTDAFGFFREWELNFEDTFSNGKLDIGKWSVKSLWAEKLLGRNYALPGDMHMFTEGANIKTGGMLHIETRKEKTEGLVWKMPAGFVPEHFDYTSGIISSAKSFWQENGIFEAKIKFQPVKGMVSSAVLQGEQSSHRVYLLEMGTKNRLGVATTGESGKMELEGLDISNLKKDKWYIFTLEKTGGNLKWKINDTEVMNMHHNKINFPLHINLLSIVVDQVSGSKLPATFHVDWVRCYHRK
jgi:hypothetical protein